MVEKPTSGSTNDAVIPGTAIAVSDVDAWFGREILPLEAALMEFLQHNWRNKSDLTDFRQDVYIRVYQAALKEIPEQFNRSNFLFHDGPQPAHQIGLKHEQVVPIEAVADLEALESAVDTPTPDRVLMARDGCACASNCSGAPSVAGDLREAIPVGSRRRAIAARNRGSDGHRRKCRRPISGARHSRSGQRILCNEPPTVRRKP